MQTHCMLGSIVALLLSVQATAQREPRHLASPAIRTHSQTSKLDFFDSNLYRKTLEQLASAIQQRTGVSEQNPSNSYRLAASKPHCDEGSAVAIDTYADGRTYPGGATQMGFGANLAKTMQRMSELANGPTGAASLSNYSGARQKLALGAGLVQSVIAAAIHIVPPLVPPPAWTNQPLPCVPMVTGHNCFGAVMYPITLADFMMADVTDSMMDGYIASFPNTFASKVGKANDAVYKGCFASYMSLHCSSIFPRCTTGLDQDGVLPVASRAPPCLHLCIMPLVMCPGFWVGDVMGPCQMVAVPPVCTQAFFWNLWRLPPQYVSLDEANPFPVDCPTKGNATDAESLEDLHLYDAPELGSSPILSGTKKL